MYAPNCGYYSTVLGTHSKNNPNLLTTLHLSWFWNLFLRNRILIFHTLNLLTANVPHTPHTQYYTTELSAGMDLPVSVTNSGPVCFELRCGARLSSYTPLTSNEEYQNEQPLQINVDSCANSEISLIAETSVSTSSTTGLCVVTVYGVPVSYYSALNYVTLSESFVCTVYNSKYTALSLSLTNSLSVAAVFRLVYCGLDFCFLFCEESIKMRK